MLDHVELVVGGEGCEWQLAGIDTGGQIEVVDECPEIMWLLLGVLEEGEREGRSFSLFETEVVLPGHGHDNILASFFLVGLFDELDGFVLLLEFLKHAIIEYKVCVSEWE